MVRTCVFQKVNIARLSAFIATMLVFVALLMSSSRLDAAVTGLEFSGGAGSALVDQYQGTGGGGWAGGWSIGADAGGTISATISNASPLNGGGNYLSTTLDSTRGTVRRDYNSELTAPALNVTSPHIIQFNYRLDSVGAGFATGGRRTVIFDSTAAGNTTGGSNTYAIQADNTGQWLAQNGNMAGGSLGNVAVGLAQSVGATYTIAIRTRPADRQYDVHISDGVNSGLLLNMGYRTSASAAGTVVHFGDDSNGSSGGVNGINSDVSFSLDALTLSNGTKSWNSVGPADWFGTTNWASEGAPSIFDNVTISNGGTVVLDNPSNRIAFAGSLTLDNGTLEVASPLEVAQGFTLGTLGTLAVDAGDLSPSDALINVGDLTLNGGTIDITGNAMSGLKLIDFSGTLTGSLSNITVNAPGNYYLVLNFAESSIELQLGAPEPSGLVLLGWGAVILLLNRRRKEA